MPTEKKTLLTAAFISAFLLSAVAGTQLVNLGRANPYIHNWVNEGEISLSDGTKPPIILLLSPKNNTTYASNNVSLALDVSMPESNDVPPLHISEMYYRASWIHNANEQLKISVNQRSINLIDIPEGPRWLEVYAVATGFAETRHEIKGIYYITYVVGYRISSSFVVNFTIDTTPPNISVLAMENKTYDTSDVPLSFTVNELVSQTSYSLDGQDNVTIAGDTVLTGLSEGEHSLTVYATDEAGNIGASETIYFSVKEPESFPTTMVIAPIASVAIIGAGLLVYFKKRNKESGGNT